MTANGYAPAVPVPGRVGQGTAIEATRAAAQVLYAVQTAKQWPRDINAAIVSMQQACRQMRLAERAFYAYPRGDGQVTGATVYLARSLADCWGNIDYGSAELRRDDEHGESEMLAFAWDMQANVRASSIFIVPHKRDTKKGVVALTDMRDIYESNANNAARRLREAIFAVLPRWYVDDAKDICSKTLKDGGGVPLPKRIASTIDWFVNRFGVSVDQLEQRVGRPNSRWNEHDVAQLGIVYRSLDRGELRVEEEFPPKQVTVEEIVGSGAPAPPSVPAQPPPPPAPAQPSPEPADAEPDGAGVPQCPACHGWHLEGQCPTDGGA